MTSVGRTVCLCMIVKDEAHVIRRCLASVRPIIDHWIVVDTGSSDGTQAVVRAAMTGLPGELVERPWVDFAHNRNEALALARPHAAYSLVIDADDELVLEDGFALPPLGDDSYAIDIHYGATIYRRPQLVSNALAWRYRGVLHEFLDCAEATNQGHLPIVMKIHHEGARSIDPATYAKDADVLAQALKAETDPFLVARYTFYLAQSYRDCGEREKAVATYLDRAALGFWSEEVYVSLLNAGRLMEALGRPPDDTLAIYARASEACPFRVEAAYAASHLCRMLSRFAQGYAIAEPMAGLPAPQPPAGLFVEPYAYEFGIFDELAVNAYWAGHHRECLDACLRALEGGKAPAHELPRIYANMRFAFDKMAHHQPDGPSGAPPRAFAGAAAEARHRYALWIVTPEAYTHARAFDDVAATLSAAFGVLGWSVPIVRRESDLAGRVPIVLGAHLLGEDHPLAADAVIFNFEQIGATGSPWNTPAYLARLARHPLLDYSLANIKALAAAGLHHAVHLPIRGMPSNTPATATTRDIDVLFYGSFNARRAAILDSLRERGLAVEARFAIYGAERDALVARAKVVLNMHFYDAAVFEAVRVGPLLARGACVVSEGAPDDPDCSGLAAALVLCPYEGLVDACVGLVGDPDRRARLAQCARDAIAARTQADILKALLAHDTPERPASGLNRRDAATLASDCIGRRRNSMAKAGSSVAIRMGSLAIAFAATMIAMYSFAQARLAWGGYNLAIALVALAVVVAARARDYEA